MRKTSHETRNKVQEVPLKDKEKTRGTKKRKQTGKNNNNEKKKNTGATELHRNLKLDLTRLRSTINRNRSLDQGTRKPPPHSRNMENT